MISVIIPVYNVENYVSQTICSVLNQTDSDYEIIVVNDGSTDNSIFVVSELLKKSNFRNYKIINQDNRGVSEARNVGIRISSGDYLVFIDGDDFVSPNLVESLNKQLVMSKANIMVWGYNTIDEDGEVISEYFKKFKFSHSILSGKRALELILDNSNELWVWTGNAAYERNFILNFNLFYTKDCINGEDLEFAFKALASAKTIYLIDEVYSYYLQRNGSISNSYNIRRFDSIIAISRIIEFLIRKEETEFSTIIKLLRNNQLIEHYFYSFNFCVQILIKQQRHSVVSGTKYLLNQIESNYEGMNSMIRSEIKIKKFVNLKDRLQKTLFLYSPTLYVLLYYFNGCLKNIKYLKIILPKAIGTKE